MDCGFAEDSPQSPTATAPLKEGSWKPSKSQMDELGLVWLEVGAHRIQNHEPAVFGQRVELVDLVLEQAHVAAGERAIPQKSSPPRRQSDHRGSGKYGYAASTPHRKPSAAPNAHSAAPASLHKARYRKQGNKQRNSERLQPNSRNQFGRLTPSPYPETHAAHHGNHPRSRFQATGNYQA